MKAIAQRRNGATAAALEGRVICHDVRGADRKIAVEKGQVLDAKAAAELLALPWEELHLLELEPGTSTRNRRARVSLRPPRVTG